MSLFELDEPELEEHNSDAAIKAETDMQKKPAKIENTEKIEKVVKNTKKSYEIPVDATHKILKKIIDE